MSVITNSTLFKNIYKVSMNYGIIGLPFNNVPLVSGVINGVVDSGDEKVIYPDFIPLLHYKHNIRLKN